MAFNHAVVWLDHQRALVDKFDLEHSESTEVHPHGGAPTCTTSMSRLVPVVPQKTILTMKPWHTQSWGAAKFLSSALPRQSTKGSCTSKRMIMSCLMQLRASSHQTILRPVKYLPKRASGSRNLTACVRGLESSSLNTTTGLPITDLEAWAVLWA